MQTSLSAPNRSGPSQDGRRSVRQRRHTPRAARRPSAVPLLRRPHDRHRDLRTLASGTPATLTNEDRNVIRHDDDRCAQARPLPTIGQLAPVACDVGLRDPIAGHRTGNTRSMPPGSSPSASNPHTALAVQRSPATGQKSEIPIARLLRPAGSCMGGICVRLPARNPSS